MGEQLTIPELLELMEKTIYPLAIMTLEEYVRDRLQNYCLVELEYFFHRAKQRKEELGGGEGVTLRSGKNVHLIGICWN